MAGDGYGVSAPGSDLVLSNQPYNMDPGKQLRRRCRQWRREPQARRLHPEHECDELGDQGGDGVDSSGGDLSASSLTATRDSWASTYALVVPSGKTGKISISGGTGDAEL